MFERAFKLAKIGNMIISAVSGSGVLALVLVGGYVIWYTVSLYQSALLGDDLLRYKPSLEEKTNPSLYELMEVNPDVIGWITIDGTNIDYPVVQGVDNLEYLNKDVFGDFSLAGAIFLDSMNHTDFSDPYNIVYGHHMDNNSVFGQVIDFLQEDYFNAHPTGILFLPEKTYAISIFTAMETNAYESKILGAKKQRGQMPSLLSYITNNAVQYRDLNPPLSADATIITLVTCENANTDGRAVLIGRLNEIDYIEQGVKEETEHEDEWTE